jgi:hypothetical protein
MYPTPWLTLLHHFSTSLFQSFGELLLRRYFGISPVVTPAKYGVYLFAMETIFLCFLLPIETIRRRMMICRVKKRYKRISGSLTVEDKSIQILEVNSSCVRIANRGFTSEWNCLYRIITEEAIGTTKNTDSFWKFLMTKTIFGGISQLYRGFWSHTLRNAAYCALKVISGLEITNDEDRYYF